MTGSQGSTFGKYILLKRLATGGMGEVFLAKLMGPVGFEKLLVVKRILHHHVTNKAVVDMFFAEARVAATLSHSNIVQIFEMGEIEDSYYIAMEYVHGKSLREVLDRAKERGENIPPALVAAIISGLAGGLSFAHNATNMSGERIGIVHRDINPQNLLISYSGEVKIIDFGIAKTDASLHQTETGTIKGKFVYMSPEQSAAGQLDKRSDIFSVGICLYEALTLVNPFAKANVVLSLDAIQRQVLPPISQTNPKLAPFDSILEKALAKNREERFQDSIDLCDALQKIVVTGAVAKSPVTLKEYMHELFEEHIERENRLILETDSATTRQIESMKEHLEREHESGSYPGPRPRQTGAAGLAGTAQMALPRHSRVPFLLLLAAILVFSGAAATAVYKIVERQRIVAARVLRPAANATPLPANTPRDTERRASPSVALAPESTAPEPTAAPVEEESGVADVEPRGDRNSAAVVDAESRRRKTVDRKRRRGRSGSRSADSPPPAAPPKQERRPTPPVSFGTMQISTDPPVRVFRGGVSVGQNVKLKSASGKLVFGTGRNPKSDPFVVRLRYTVEDGQMRYVLDAEPWAIARLGNGIGLGRTPQKATATASKTVFELANPQKGLRLRITLRYTR
jgi:serine/threonine-protein kinase